MSSKIVRVLLAALLVTTTLIPIATLGDKASALSGSDFKAGRIMDDIVFFQPKGFSLQEIQSFLNAKVPTCDTNGTQPYSGTTAAQYGTSKGYPPPYTCLKDYRVTTTAKNPEAGLCNGYPAANHSAAEIIYNVAQSCGINPRVLIVLLQKEQGLVTDDWPWSLQYRSATGYGCPDTAPCDAEYYGFFNQVYMAARQFKRYAQSPNSYNYLPNRNNNIQFSPSAGCGYSTVFVQNQTTAGLYNYTPYQPNPAALAGMNDSTAGGTATCGAYGNRNFFWYYTKWFGPTVRSLITTPGAGIYQVENGTKRAFPSELIFFSYANRWSDVLTVTNAEFNQIPDGAVMPYNTHYRDGILVRNSSGGMYVVDNGTKRPFPNEDTFTTLGYKYTDALAISTAELNLIPEGAPMRYDTHRRDGFLVRDSSGGIYVVASGTKKPFPNEETFFSYKYTFSDAVVISTAELNLIPIGTPMPYNVNFRNGYLVTHRSGGVYVVDSGTKRPFPNESTFFSYGYKYSDALVISSTEVNLIPEGIPMPKKN